MRYFRGRCVLSFLAGPAVLLCPCGSVMKKNHTHRPLAQGSVFVTVQLHVLGGSGGFVNYPDFCPASLKSFGCFYFWCILSSQWKAVAVNLRILHCQL